MGKRNGKGKEYDEGNLKFEGEYLNGQRRPTKIKYKNSKKWRIKNNKIYNLKLKLLKTNSKIKSNIK